MKPMRRVLLLCVFGIAAAIVLTSVPTSADLGLVGDGRRGGEVSIGRASGASLDELSIAVVEDEGRRCLNLFLLGSYVGSMCNGLSSFDFSGQFMPGVYCSRSAESRLELAEFIADGDCESNSPAVRGSSAKLLMVEVGPRDISERDRFWIELGTVHVTVAEDVQLTLDVRALTDPGRIARELERGWAS